MYFVNPFTDSSSKIGMILGNKVLKKSFLIEKKIIRKIWMILDIENSLLNLVLALFDELSVQWMDSQKLVSSALPRNFFSIASGNF